MTRQTIGIDARMIGSSGIGTYLQGLLQGLGAARDTFYFSLHLLGDSEIPPGPWSVQTATSPIYSLREQWEIPRACRGLKANLLHVPHYNMPCMMASKTVVTVHDLIHLKFPEYWPSPVARAYARFFFYQVVPKAKAILTVSENTKRDLMEMLSAFPRIASRSPIRRSIMNAFAKKDPLIRKKLSSSRSSGGISPVYRKSKRI